MNRFQIQQMLDGVRATLKSENEKLNAMYMDSKSTVEARNNQVAVVKDLEEREKGIAAQLKKFDDDAAAKLQTQKDPKAMSERDKAIENKAEVIRNVMNGNKDGASNAIKSLGGRYTVNALSTNSSTGNGGGSFIPKTTSADIITEPVYENDLRAHILVTSESNLEVPRLLFSCDDDEFVLDEDTAKEVKAKGDTVEFGRNKSKLKVNVSETVLLGSNANLVATVDSGLEGAAAYKEVKMMFSKADDANKHMSFYEKELSEYTIKKVEGSSKYLAIKKAIADLPKMYRKNAKIIMSYMDYLDIIETLANGNATLYTAQPEQILGKPVVFMDEAEIPVVGDLKYLQINYHPETLYDRDKDVDSGMEKFVLTNWYDIQFRLRSAFRLAVTP
jgi:HK97 family phage major capsid protein|nr:MAG TPA: major capsid protein [Caudoviricetes sp.]